MMVTADDDSSGKFAVFSEYTCQPYSYTHLAAELFKCRLVHRRRRQRQLLGGEGPISETPSVTFSLFWHEASLG